MADHWMKTFARMLPKEDTLISCSGRAQTIALRTNGLAQWQRGEDICRFFSGQELTAAHGTRTLAPSC